MRSALLVGDFLRYRNWIQASGIVNALRLPMDVTRTYTAPVSSHAIVVSDAHIGYGPPEVEASFCRFLERVPDLAEHVIINGDLFEFWFEYRAVIPKQAFRTLAALAAVRRAGVRLTVTGGNHDRWGGEFWEREVGARFHSDEVELELGQLRSLIRHGDGVVETRWSARAFHSLVRHPVTTRLFRLLHPDAGFAVVRRMSPHLAGKEWDTAERSRAAERQEEYARGLLRERGDLNLVILGHTHVPRLVAAAGEQWFLNPGAWNEGCRYARITPDGPVLEAFEA
jgi:UDP-2,3-diacylglucosamine hydrolase